MFDYHFFFCSEKYRALNFQNKNIFSENSKLGSCFQKLFLKKVFENTENTIFMFFENYSCSLNLVFFCVLCVLINKKNLGTKRQSDNII